MFDFGCFLDIYLNYFQGICSNIENICNNQEQKEDSKPINSYKTIYTKIKKLSQIRILKNWYQNPTMEKYSIVMRKRKRNQITL